MILKLLEYNYKEQIINISFGSPRVGGRNYSDYINYLIHN
jgi:hypothetical protein